MKQTGCGCLCGIIIITCIVVWICQPETKTEKTKTQERTQIPGVPSEEEYKKEQEEQEERDRALVCSFLCRSLKELYDFKDDMDFHKIGFGVGGKYNAWLKKIEENRKLALRLPNRFFTIKVAAGEIMQCGFEFMKSEGFETEYTRKNLPEIEKAIGYQDYLRRIAEIEASMKK